MRIILILITTIFSLNLECYSQVYTSEDYLGAKEFCTQKILENPNDYFYYKARADIEFTLKEFDAAITDYSFAITRNAISTESIYNRGVAYYEINKINLAEKDFIKALEIKIIPEAYLYLGLICESKSKNQKAIKYYSLAIRDSISYSDAYYNRGLCSSKISNFSNAVEDFKIAYRLTKNTNSQINLALSYAKLKKNDLADFEINVAIKRDSTNANVYKYKGLILLENAEFKEACVCFLKAKKMGANNIDAYFKKYCTN